MMNIYVGIVVIMHGLVHLLYFGHSRRFFKLQPGMSWPDGSWAFSKLAGEHTSRVLAGMFCIISAVGFVISGIALIAEQPWWNPFIIGTALFSSLVFILFWDGNIHKLADKGVIAIILNIALPLTGLIITFQ